MKDEQIRVLRRTAGLMCAMGYPEESDVIVQMLAEHAHGAHAPTRIEDMTNGNSSERKAFEKWASDQGWCNFTRINDGYAMDSLNDVWTAWDARAALSVCADGGKDSSDTVPVAYLSTEPRNWGGCRIKPQGTFTVPVYSKPSDGDLQDAKRYRFARDHIKAGYELGRGFYLSDAPERNWDKTIDAAIAKEKK